MRSRDGSNTFSLTIRSIIFLFSLAQILSADEYLISYRYIVKDAVIYNETLNIAKAMKKCQSTPLKDTLILEKYGKKNLKLTISKNMDEFTKFIQKLPLSVEHRGKTINNQNHSTTIITLKTRCFKVDFNENFVKIAPFKQGYN
jgi:cell fate (sporulation/competence/biofilm development) regulator YmcA (YheA/YmcA/DUF963 family)